ncbi:hypothetical protein [Bradyrhizobium embrapense]|uniref:hypothetical protein n=1 Tax=Bradyrhizobium embrapense TaxID=630921 RepID=UPI001FCDA106|nr:hypothetical protein [Bradyrhizobium embrapense]
MQHPRVGWQLLDQIKKNCARSGEITCLHKRCRLCKLELLVVAVLLLQLLDRLDEVVGLRICDPPGKEISKPCLDLACWKRIEIHA